MVVTTGAGGRVLALSGWGQGCCSAPPPHAGNAPTENDRPSVCRAKWADPGLDPLSSSGGETGSWGGAREAKELRSFVYQT